MSTEATPEHPREDRCFDCASDEEIEAAFAASGPHPTIHWQGVFCPHDHTKEVSE